MRSGCCFRTQCTVMVRQQIKSSLLQVRETSLGLVLMQLPFQLQATRGPKTALGPCPRLMACVNTIADHLAPTIARALSNESVILTVEDGTGGQLGGVVRACESDCLSLRIPSCGLYSYESHCSSHGTSFIDSSITMGFRWSNRQIH